MNTTRLLNAMSDCYTALRLAGWSADEASKIVAEQATKFVNSLPIRPYPKEPERTMTDGNEGTRDGQW